MRCFISIGLPSEMIKKIQGIQEILPEFMGKKTGAKNLHLTLKFLGEISEEKVEEVKRRLSKIKAKSFEIEIGSLGVFSENFVRIIWLHLKGAEDLQGEIDGMWGSLFEKEKRFMGHLTIARVKKIKDKKLFLEKLKRIKFDKMDFRVEEFSLMKSVLRSEGPAYENLKRYNLESS